VVMSVSVITVCKMVPLSHPTTSPAGCRMADHYARLSSFARLRMHWCCEHHLVAVPHEQQPERITCSRTSATKTGEGVGGARSRDEFRPERSRFLTPAH